MKQANARASPFRVRMPKALTRRLVGRELAPTFTPGERRTCSLLNVSGLGGPTDRHTVKRRRCRAAYTL